MGPKYLDYNPADIQGTVFKNGSATLLARVMGAGGSALVPDDLVSAKYTIYLIDEDDYGASTVVSGHEDVIVPVSLLISDALQTDLLWDVDSIGYNFGYVLDMNGNQAFTEAGRTYRIVFELMPTNGQVILVRFRVHTI